MYQTSRISAWKSVLRRNPFTIWSSKPISSPPLSSTNPSSSILITELIPKFPHNFIDSLISLPYRQLQQNRFISSESNQPLWPTSIKAIADMGDKKEVMRMYETWFENENWSDVITLYEFWVQNNKPDLHMCKHYLRAQIKTGASVQTFLDILAKIDNLNVQLDTECFNFILEAMKTSNDCTNTKLIWQRMKQPDENSFKLVTGIFLAKGTIITFEDALQYVYETLNAGFFISKEVLDQVVISCVHFKRFSALTLLLEKLMKEDKARVLPWKMCTFILNVSLENGQSSLTSCVLELLKKHSPFEDTIGQNRVPSAQAYLVDIYSYSAHKDFKKAFATLRELESAYGGKSDAEEVEDLFSPFTSLHPLVIACTKSGVNTLDLIYKHLVKLSLAQPPYKSVAALNVILLGYAYICDGRVGDTFTSIEEVFGLTPDVNSHNALKASFKPVKYSRLPKTRK